MQFWFEIHKTIFMDVLERCPTFLASGSLLSWICVDSGKVLVGSDVKNRHFRSLKLLNYDS